MVNPSFYFSAEAVESFREKLKVLAVAFAEYLKKHPKSTFEDFIKTTESSDCIKSCPTETGGLITVYVEHIPEKNILIIEEWESNNTGRLCGGGGLIGFTPVLDRVESHGMLFINRTPHDICVCNTDGVYVYWAASTNPIRCTPNPAHYTERGGFKATKPMGFSEITGLTPSVGLNEYHIVSAIVLMKAQEDIADLGQELNEVITNNSYTIDLEYKRQEQRRLFAEINVLRHLVGFDPDPKMVKRDSAGKITSQGAFMFLD